MGHIPVRTDHPELEFLDSVPGGRVFGYIEIYLDSMNRLRRTHAYDHHGSPSTR
jgi:hypothetical protein